jgi:hypothetical protein
MPQSSRRESSGSRGRLNTIPFPTQNAKPTDHFDLKVPKSAEDANVGIDYYQPAMAHLAQAQADQTILFAPDGSAFVFRISPRTASSASATFGA